MSNTAICLRIYVGEKDNHQHQPLYEALILKARELNLKGATVYRSPMGFGHSHVLHTAKIMPLSEDLPMIVEIIDSETAIKDYLSAIKPMLPPQAGLMTQHNVTLI